MQKYAKRRTIARSWVDLLGRGTGEASPGFCEQAGVLSDSLEQLARRYARSVAGLVQRLVTLHELFPQMNYWNASGLTR